MSRHLVDTLRLPATEDLIPSLGLRACLLIFLPNAGVPILSLLNALGPDGPGYGVGGRGGLLDPSG